MLPQNMSSYQSSAIIAITAAPMEAEKRINLCLILPVSWYLSHHLDTLHTRHW